MATPITALKDRPLIAAWLPVKNEEANVPRCVTSLDGFADEINMAGTGSTGPTVENAGLFGAWIKALLLAQRLCLPPERVIRHGDR